MKDNDTGTREVFAGACQCGAVGYRVEGRSLALFCCHCSECQAQSGSAFGMALWVAPEKVALSGLPMASWVRDTPSGKRMTCEFCPACGSRLFHRMDSNRDILSIKPGTLRNHRLPAPVAHIWTASAPDWTQFDGNCLAYPGNPPDFAPLFAAWKQQAAARNACSPPSGSGE